jgi:hypothetical protein
MVVMEYDDLVVMEQQVLVMDELLFPMVLNIHLFDDNLLNNVYSMMVSVYLNVHNDYDYLLNSY